MKHLGMNMSDRIRRCLILVSLFLLTMGCGNRKPKFTKEQLTNTIAFAAYPSEPADDDPYGSSKEIFIIKAESGAKMIRITYNRNWEEQPVWIDAGISLVFMRCIGRVGSPNSKWFLYKRNLFNAKDARLLEVNHGTEIKASKNLYLLKYSKPNPPLCYLDTHNDSTVMLFTAKDVGITVWGPGSGIRDFSIDKEERKFALTIADGIRLKEKKLAKEEWKCHEIAIVNRDGTNFQMLTNDTFPDFSPAISPDGKFITFESERNDNRDIYLMEIATKELKRLTNHPSLDRSPSWSPDGKKIAFISERDGFSHIWIINADGTGIYQLTKGKIHVSPGISWSPR